MPKNYTTYHTNVKLCYSLGIEKQIFPKEFTDKIPVTTSQYWKNKNANHYLGYEYEELSAKAIEEIKLLYDERTKKMKQLFFTFFKLYISVITIIGKRSFQEIIKTNRRKLIPLIDDCVEKFGNKKLFLKLLGISVQQYAHWKKLESYLCPKSLIWLCYKRVPRQISPKEIGMMKSLMSEKDKLHWSSGAVWGFGVRHGKISMARATWYLYCKLLSLSESRKKYKKLVKKTSVRAEKPNQIWHMDVSVYKTSDNIKLYIYSVVDNFSRKILAYDFSKELSAVIRLKSLRRAVETEFGVNIGQDMAHPKLNLIVDGGSENNNKTVEEFITESQVNITKLIALKDVTYSNNMVENPFKTMKSKYFRGKEIFESTFAQELHHFVQDFNSERPHYAHELYTPDEVHLNPEIKGTRPDLAQARQKRLETNRNYCCKAFKVVA